MSIELIWQPQGVVKRYFDQLTGQDILRGVEQVEGDERFDQIRYVLNDMRPIQSVILESIAEGLIEEIAAIDMAASLTNPHLKVAIVATHPVATEYALQYAHSELCAYPTAVFDNLEAAIAWLGYEISYR